MLGMNSLAHTCKMIYNRHPIPNLSPSNVSMSRKWFMQALGVEQFHKLLAGFDDKGAEAVCTFAYSEGPGCEPIIFQGRTHVCYISNACWKQLVL